MEHRNVKREFKKIILDFENSIFRRNESLIKGTFLIYDKFEK